MMWRPWIRVATLVALLAGCDGEVNEDAGPDVEDAGTDAGGATNDAGMDAHVPPADAGPPFDAGPPPTDAGPMDGGAPDAGGCVGSCDDSIGCTLDSCVAGTCVHEPRHRMCGEGVFCLEGMGCTGGQICSGDSDCPTSSDGCVRDVRCSSATRVCAWDILDGDGDGEPPVVCGGTDCDDSMGTVFVGATELCNGVDDDCDGTTDNGAASTACTSGRSCVAGACVCGSGETDCGADGCRDVDTDPTACGSCGTACLPGQLCATGTCACPAGEVVCAGACSDLSSDASNCGVCGTVCPAGGSCVSGACACPAGSVECASGCSVTASDPNNCGGCEVACFERATCGSGTCSSVVSNLVAWQSRAFGGLGGGTHVRAHPGGDVTVGTEFLEYLDVVPLMGIATTPATSYFVTRRTPMGSERWRRIVEISSGFVDLALVGDPMQDDAWIVGDIGRAGAVVDFGGGPSTLTKTVVAAARYDGGTGALAWSRTFASSASGSSAPSVIAAAAGPTGRIAFLISVTDFNATDFGGGTLGTGLTSTHRAAVILDATGAHEASWVFSSPRIEAEHIAFAPDGTVVVAGDYHNVMPTIASSALPVAGSLSNAFVARYGPGGVGLGAFALASPTESTGIRQLAVMASGDIAVGTFDDFVASYSPTGTLRWNIATPRDFAMPGASMTYMHRAGTGLFAVGFQRNGYVLGGAPLTQPRFFAEIASDGSVGRVRGFDFFLQDARAVSATRWAAFGTWTAMASQRIQDRVVTLGSGGPTTPSGAFYFELAP